MSLGSRIPALVLSGVMAMGAAAIAVAQTPAAVANADDPAIQADVNKALDNKRLRGVTGKVVNGMVTLSGTVPVYADKAEAAKRVQKATHKSVPISNQIQVEGAEVSDQALGQKLAGKLTIDGLDPNRTAFEIFNVSVQHGAVTLQGFALDPSSKDWAESTVADVAGVKDLVDKIQVAPPSPMDARVRQDEFRAIYGYPTFTKYAINPAKTIRILVLNGNVTLAGVVDTQTDKEQASLRANGVGGVFHVTNDLQVAGANER